MERESAPGPSKDILRGIMIPCPPTALPIGYVLEEPGRDFLTMPIRKALNTGSTIWPFSISDAPSIAFSARIGSTKETQKGKIPNPLQP